MNPRALFANVGNFEQVGLMLVFSASILRKVCSCMRGEHEAITMRSRLCSSMASTIACWPGSEQVYLLVTAYATLRAMRAASATAQRRQLPQCWCRSGKRIPYPAHAITSSFADLLVLALAALACACACAGPVLPHGQPLLLCALLCGCPGLLPKKRGRVHEDRQGGSAW